MKRILTILTVAIMTLTAVPCTAFAESGGETVILYTNDVHCAIDDYAELAAYRAQLEADGYEVLTIDAGDAIQGEAIGTLTEGSAIVDLMNSVGYDYAVPGNHEFDYGMEAFLGLTVGGSQYEYLSCNFVDLRTAQTVLPSWQMEEANGEKIAIVGIATPESYTKTSPVFFQDEKGNDIYGFSEERFYDVIQNSVDDALDAGADRVIAVGHLGITGTTEGWKSTDVIANTTGIDAFIDAHTHEVIPEITYYNEEGDAVVLSSTGSKFQYFGQMTLARDGSEETELITPESVDVNSSDAAKAAYTEVQTKVDAYNEEIAELEEVLGTAEVELTLNDPDTGEWVIRSAETNMGDFVADAYRTVSGADIALVNSGGIRASIGAGEITRKELMDINPWNNEMCVVRATGQQILDALEFGARMYPVECGGFLQVSGLTYEIQSWISSPVILDQKGSFQEVNEDYPRRVTDVTVGGAPLVLDETYTVAASYYLLREGGDGFTMFMDTEIVAGEGLPVDSEMLIQYLEEDLDGTVSADKYGKLKGDGRILVIAEEDQMPEIIPDGSETQDDRNDGWQELNDEEKDAEKATSEKNVTEREGSPQTGDNNSDILLLCLMMMSVTIAVMASRRRKI